MKRKQGFPNKPKNKAERRRANPAQRRLAKQNLNLQDAMDAAIGHFYGGRPALAADLCRDILSASPNNANACYLLGVISHQAGQDQAAIDLISRSLEHEPENTEAHNYLGIVLVNAERHQDAAKSFRRAIELQPGFPEAHNNLGNVMRQLGRLDDAVANFRQALMLRPDYVQASNGLGCSLRELGQREEAAASFRKAIAGDSNHYEAHYSLAELLCDLGHDDGAVECFRKAIGIKPDDAGAYINLGYLLQKLGRQSEAAALYRQAIGIEPDNAAVHNNLGIALAEQGELEAAAASYRKALALDPGLADAHNNLGLALQELGTAEEAAAAFENALGLCEAPELKAKILLGLSQLPSPAIRTDILTPIEALSKHGLDAGQGEIAALFQRNLAFARAAALDRQGRYEEAWQGFAAANREVNSIYAKTWPLQLRRIEDALKRARAWTWREERPESGASSLPAPLFILGPSRCGKTSLEKLAGSLDGVKCDYEGLIVSHCVRSASRSDGNAAPGSLAELPKEHGPAFLRLYRDEIARAAGQARILTNTNQAYIGDAGWLARMLPATRFIFVERNEEDTAVRIFMKLYRENTNHYAYDLKHIFEYLSWYQQLFDVWEARLGDVILRLTYEDIIANPERTREKLAAFLGLKQPAAGAPAPALGDDRAAAAPYMDFLKAAR